MRKGLIPVIFIGITVGIPALAGWVGYRQGRSSVLDEVSSEPWKVNSLIRDRVEKRRQVHSVAGLFDSMGLEIDGLERCYYQPMDFTQVTWNSPAMPTPYVGYAPVPGRYLSAEFNRQQFRYGRDISRRTPKDVCRIFIVGGSVAYGAGASSNARTLAGYLESYLNEDDERWKRRFEVVTFAAPAWSSTHERIAIVNRVLEFEPDVVISFTGFNDAFWGLQSRNVNWFRAFQDDYFFHLTNTVLALNFDEGFPLVDPGTEPVAPISSCFRLVRNLKLIDAACQELKVDYCVALQPIAPLTAKKLTAREERMSTRVATPGMKERFEALRKTIARLELAKDRYVDLTGHIRRDRRGRGYLLRYLSLRGSWQRSLRPGPEGFPRADPGAPSGSVIAGVVVTRGILTRVEAAHDLQSATPVGDGTGCVASPGADARPQKPGLKIARIALDPFLGDSVGSPEIRLRLCGFTEFLEAGSPFEPGESEGGVQLERATERRDGGPVIARGGERPTLETVNDGNSRRETGGEIEVAHRPVEEATIVEDHAATVSSLVEILIESNRLLVVRERGVEST